MSLTPATVPDDAARWAELSGAVSGLHVVVGLLLNTVALTRAEVRGTDGFGEMKEILGRLDEIIPTILGLYEQVEGGDLAARGFRKAIGQVTETAHRNFEARRAH